MVNIYQCKRVQFGITVVYAVFALSPSTERCDLSRYSLQSAQVCTEEYNKEYTDLCQQASALDEQKKKERL